MVRPRPHRLSEQSSDRLRPSPVEVWSSIAEPLRLAVARNLEKVHLCHNPDQECREGCWEKEARNTAERGFGDTGESPLNVSRLRLADGLQRAHVAGDEGEDCDTQTSLNEDADDWPLQHSR